MIRIKTTGRAMPNTTQWTEHSGLKRDKSRPYAFDETSAHLLINRTKSVKDSNDRFGLNKI